MKAIEELENPYQRAALLLVRWSGARRGEVRRLTLDCLDAYPDGYPRLRIPVGKTYTERMIPLHPQGADALRELIELGKAAAPYPRTGSATPVGTQLAEGGAQIQTIMAILGHRNASMSATYSHISDPVLREQYEKVIAAGGRVAGPAAEALLSNQINQDTLRHSQLRSVPGPKASTRWRPPLG
jgi:integrase